MVMEHHCHITVLLSLQVSDNQQKRTNQRQGPHSTTTELSTHCLTTTTHQSVAATVYATVCAEHWTAVHSGVTTTRDQPQRRR